MYSIICFVSVITSLRMFIHNDAHTCRLVMWFVQSFGVRRLHITLEHEPVLKSLEAIVLSIRSKSESLKVYTSSCDCMIVYNFQVSTLLHFRGNAPSSISEVWGAVPDGMCRALVYS